MLEALMMLDTANETAARPPQVSVIIPARNEEASLGACLASIVGHTGVPVEIIVVNDHSTDRTREIAASFPGVQVIDAGPLPPGWTGKNNAVATGARHARGHWLLFTDADTIHRDGALARALAEADLHNVVMLSYSPEQIAVTFWEMATLPVVFAELARQYSPSKVSDPTSPIAAANGQFILIRRDAYNAVGGHAAVAGDILEDVALARNLKKSGRKIRFRYAADAVRTRMYRSYRDLRDGWIKNLAILFPHPGRLALLLFTWWAIAWVALILGLANVATRPWGIAACAIPLLLLTARIYGAKFALGKTALAAAFGVPVFCYLLLRSKRAHANQSVSWKGRTYNPQDSANHHSMSTQDTDKPMNDAIHPASNDLMKHFVTFVFATMFLFTLSAGTASAQAAYERQVTIEPGLGIGPLKLGDSRDHVLELFPRKTEDQEWQNSCGTTLDWVDSTNRAGHGDLFVRLNKKGKVFQIESSTTRFHTGDGITTFDHADKVAEAYHDMRAYTLLTPPVPALGDRPLVFWIDKKKGVAFVFAYDPSERKRYLYKIVVFEPNKTFCPEEEKTDSPKWQSIPSYALEPPAELAPNLR